MSLGRTFSIGTHGLKIPAVGLGTWNSAPGQVRTAVATAIAAGYRHIDCAAIYQNESEVGQGIKDAGVAREKLWLTSKLWNSSHSPERVELALDETLKNLGVSYLDLYLMHWPVAFAKGKREDGKPNIDWALTEDPLPTWRALEALVESGKVKHIGISNFTIGRAKRLLAQAKIKPVVNQVELNLRCAQPELVAWSKANGILLEAYSPLGSTGAPQLEDEVVQEIAKAHKVDPANVLISWQIQRGLVVLPKSVTPSRIKSNFQDVELTSAEVDKLEARAKELGESRTVDPSKGWGVKIFEDGPSSKL
ncbi:NADP-dependent oxidoreductase domain-containing protein [Leucosporidium creatinivorum]|uniref:NADP-dependent oxidoreductase domain-containing protein n=1 Tax=Leucosporidium creatinivorum TaxID=106004 RepID=A0A1Y2F148_9BASI|nr:NADP-dependent oxidoreductase domain-containing protein [Leucosporidium creatinivorum]